MTTTSANTAESPASAITALEELARLASLQASVSVALVEATSMPEMLGRCAEAIVRELSVAFARVWTLSDDQTTLELRASAGANAKIDGAQSRIPVGQFKIGKIAKEHVPLLTNSIAGDPQIHDQEWAKREGLVAFAGHPLLVDDRLVGVLAVFSRSALPAATATVVLPIPPAPTMVTNLRASSRLVTAPMSSSRPMILVARIGRFCLSRISPAVSGPTERTTGATKQ